jgi:hypothetical protein
VCVIDYKYYSFFFLLFSRILEWVEFVDPFSKERKFINLTTGDCCLEAPVNIEV